jgi:arylsulfatase A-like enzyme
VYLFPDVLRVPLSVKMPGVAPRVIDETVSHLDIAPTLLGAANLEPMERLDGRPLTPYLGGTGAHGDRNLLFECGWHVGVNFACAIQRQSAQGHHLYTYNTASDVDELYDLASADAVNLAQKPEHTGLHKEMVQRMGSVLERDPRWIGYWHSFRIDHYDDLPRRGPGDVQMFRPA